MRRTTLALTMALAGVVACGSQQTASKPAPSNINIISAKELEDPSVQGTDALAAIKHLRPSYFLIRPGGSIQNRSAGTVHVSIDGGALQGVDNLSRFRVNDLAEVRYLNSTDATQRFGTAAGSGGVILVKTK